MDDPPDSSIDKVLSRAAATGDSMSWSTLYERHFARLYGYVYHKTQGKKDQIEDVLQECWLIAVRRIGDFDSGRGDFASWLRGIADNVVRSERRKRARHADSSVVEMQPASDGTSLPRPEDGLAEEIARALASLPPSYQDVLKAKYESELSVAEIAERWDKTSKTIESLLSRARAAFRESFTNLKENS